MGNSVKRGVWETEHLQGICGRVCRHQEVKKITKMEIGGTLLRISYTSKGSEAGSQRAFAPDVTIRYYKCLADVECHCGREISRVSHGTGHEFQPSVIDSPTQNSRKGL